MRKNPLVLLMGLLVFAGFVLYMITYTVRFSDEAIVTTFGKVGENSVKEKAGLRFKMPAPLQSVTIYDKRSHVLSAQPETHETLDNRQIVVSAFLTWNISDPLKFYQSYSTESTNARLQEREAEKRILGQFRSAVSQTSKYRLDQLFTSDPAGSRLGELEADILAALRGGEGGDGNLAKTGVEITMVGINRIELPESATSSVFERMRTVRSKIATDVTQEATSEAANIRSDADAAAQKILAFARLRAAEIERRGQDEAAQWYAVLNEYPELAILLTEVETLERVLPGKLKLILGPDSPAYGMFSADKFVEWQERARRDGAAAPSGVPATQGEGDLPDPTATTTEAGQ